MRLAQSFCVTIYIYLVTLCNQYFFCWKCSTLKLWNKYTKRNKKKWNKNKNQSYFNCWHFILYHISHMYIQFSVALYQDTLVILPFWTRSSATIEWLYHVNKKKEEISSHSFRHHFHFHGIFNCITKSYGNFYTWNNSHKSRFLFRWNFLIFDLYFIYLVWDFPNTKKKNIKFC